MKVGKPKSKRVPVRLRHKIEKASAAKQRKDRKQAKKNPQWRSRLKKDPGIPNLFPYKDKILAEIEESKRKKEEEAQKRKETAKARRQGTVVAENAPTAMAGVINDDDEALIDYEDEEDDDDEEMEEDEKNPMAALIASVQARVQDFSKHDDDEDEDEDGNEEEEWAGVADDTLPSKKSNPNSQPAAKTLPKRALEDPIKTISLLISRLEQQSQSQSSETSEALSKESPLQPLLTHYSIPPLVTAGSTTTTRFLVEVARKRGRLGRGGVPNLSAAALTVLGDLNEGRVLLPSLTSTAKVGKGKGAQVKKGEVQLDEKLEERFRIEGLFGDDGQEEEGDGGMEVE